MIWWQPRRRVGSRLRLAGNLAPKVWNMRCSVLCVGLCSRDFRPRRPLADAAATHCVRPCTLAVGCGGRAAVVPERRCVGKIARFGNKKKCVRMCARAYILVRLLDVHPYMGASSLHLVLSARPSARAACLCACFGHVRFMLRHLDKSVMPNNSVVRLVVPCCIGQCCAVRRKLHRSLSLSSRPAIRSESVCMRICHRLDRLCGAVARSMA